MDSTNKNHLTMSFLDSWRLRGARHTPSPPPPSDDNQGRSPKQEPAYVLEAGGGGVGRGNTGDRRRQSGRDRIALRLG